jgi:nucleoside-triphosphatase THEP1
VSIEWIAVAASVVPIAFSGFSVRSAIAAAKEARARLTETQNIVEYAKEHGWEVVQRRREQHDSIIQSQVGPPGTLSRDLSEAVEQQAEAVEKLSESGSAK